MNGYVGMIERLLDREEIESRSLNAIGHRVSCVCRECFEDWQRRAPERALAERERPEGLRRYRKAP